MVVMMIMMLNDDGGVDITKMNDPDSQKITNTPTACHQRRGGESSSLQSSVHQTEIDLTNFIRFYPLRMEVQGLI